MSQKGDIIVGRIALAGGLITREQLDECIEIQKKDTNARPLGTIMVQKGYLTSDQLQSISNLQENDQGDEAEESQENADSGANDSSSDSSFSIGLFGKKILKAGYVTRDQLEEGLKIQKKLERKGKVVRLGEVLVKKGYMTSDQVREVLKEQEKALAFCESCEVRYNVPKSQTLKKIECPKCGGELETSEEGEISTEEAHFDEDQKQLKTILGKEIGGVVVTERVGRGSMATVYKGQHSQLDKLMAVKILHPSIQDREETSKGFLEEAKMVAKLEHPNIVRVYNAGEDKGVQFIHLEFIRGVSLDEVLETRDRVNEDKVLSYVKQISEGIQYAHENKIVHQDIKLSNLLLSKDGTLKIADFGISQLLGEHNDQKSDSPFVGTPYYMSPEQWRREETDQRSDLYALGVCMYKLLTGRYPFDAATFEELGKLHVNKKPVPPDAFVSNLSEGVVSIVRKLMAKHPEDRYQSAEALGEDIRRIGEGFEPRSLLDTEDTVECNFCSTINGAKRSHCRVCNEDLRKQDIDSMELG